MNLQQFTSNYPDIQFLPIKITKNPAVETWSKTDRTAYDFRGAAGVGLICGAISGDVEVIDVDCKYDLTGKLFVKFVNSIKQIDPDLVSKLTVQKTPKKGYHLIYKCSKRDGNLKLARRFTTEQEKHETYEKTYEKQFRIALAVCDSSEAVEIAKGLAETAKKNDKVRVLIETRGDGGYIACYPTPGYELIHGDFGKINHITPQQRDLIFTQARLLNEYFEEYRPEKKSEIRKTTGKTSCDHYNEDGDVVALLEKHGWTVKGHKGSKTFLLRPGDTDSAQSGNYDSERNWFTVFSTSTQFETEKAYRPYMVYAILECEGDFTKTAAQLYDLGFGDKTELKHPAQPIKIKPELPKDDLSFLATEEDFEGYMTAVRNGTFQMGRSTGFKETLDRYFLFKESNFVVINGHDNVGKTVIIWYLALLSAMFYGWKWMIFSSENSIGFFMRKMIEFYWGEHIESISEDKYQQAKRFIHKHFKVIKSEEDLYNARDIVRMTQTYLNSGAELNGLLVDPYNSLKIELTPSAKLSTHEYHYEVISEMKLFGKRNNLSIYLNCHAVTNALRQKGTDGMPSPPGKADTEGGGKFGNKADDFLTIHRKPQSADESMVTEIHVRKIKETESGGKVTQFADPVKLKAINRVTGFVDSEGENPIATFHGKSKPIMKLVDRTEPISSLQPNFNFDNNDNDTGNPF